MKSLLAVPRAHSRSSALGRLSLWPPWVLDDKLEAKFNALMAIGHLTSRQNARLTALMRERAELVEKRKKRKRKRKTPKTSSSCGRPHRRHRQCHFHGWFSWCCSSRCVLPFGRQAQDALLLGRCVPEGQLSVACAMAGIAGYVTFALCSLLLSAGRVVHFLDKLFSPVVVQRQVRVLVWTVYCSARGDSTGAVLGRGYGHYRCRGPDSANRLEVSQLQVIFKVVDFPFCGAEANPHDYVRFPSCRTLGGSCPCRDVAGAFGPDSAGHCLEVPQMQFCALGRRCVHAATSSQQSWEVLRLTGKAVMI